MCPPRSWPAPRFRFLRDNLLTQMPRVVRERTFDPKLQGLTVNARVEIRSEDKKHPGHYLSRVEDLDKKLIALSAPQSNGKPVAFTTGEPVRVGYQSEAGFFGFKTTVTGVRLTGRVPRLYLDKPEKVFQIERREFFRLDVLVPADFNPTNRPDDAYPATITNLSGGGCRFITERPISEDDVIELHFKVPGGSVKMRSRVLEATEVTVKGEKRNRAETKFVDTNEGMRDRVIEYVFDRHRETIRTRSDDRKR